MKVLMIYHAGMHLHSRKIFEAFAAHREIDLSVIVPAVYRTRHVGVGGELRLDRSIDENGYRLIPVPLRNSSEYSEGFQTGPLWKALRACRPNVTHVLDEPISGYLPQVVWLLKLSLSRSRILCYGFENLPLRMRLSRPKWLATWRMMDGATASNSEALENLRAAGFPRSRPMERIFFGIPVDLFTPVDKTQARKDLGLSHPFIVGGVGGLLPEKGWAVLLAALRYLPADVHCVIVGSGPARAELELWSGLPELKERVNIVGRVNPPDLPKLYSCFDALVVPSRTTRTWKEQFGRVIAEAMACGVPVIGSDSGAIPEVIGGAGLIFPEDDPSALAQAIRLLLENRILADDLGGRGRDRAHAMFSAAAFAAKHVAFYRRLLDSRRGPSS